ncbi:unnamed protein product, partial [Cyprideis torosa]
APDVLAKYISAKGSICVDGTSLTVNKVNGAQFELNIVPHTLQETIMGHYQSGSKVNLEVDVIARYLERLLLGDKAAEPMHSEGGTISRIIAEHRYLCLHNYRATIQFCGHKMHANSMHCYAIIQGTL